MDYGTNFGHMKIYAVSVYVALSTSSNDSGILFCMLIIPWAICHNPFFKRNRSALQIS